MVIFDWFDPSVPFDELALVERLDLAVDLAVVACAARRQDICAAR